MVIFALTLLHSALSAPLHGPLHPNMAFLVCVHVSKDTSHVAPAMQAGEEPAGREESETVRAFQEAAERLRQKREEQSLTADQRILRSLQRYMAEWKADLDARPREAANTTMGVTVRSCRVAWCRHGSVALHLAWPALQGMSTQVQMDGATRALRLVTCVVGLHALVATMCPN